MTRLTEDIVLKLGFIQGSAPWKDGVIKFDDFNLDSVTIYPISGNSGQWQVAYLNKMLLIFIEYVHELQDLFYTFTQKELAWIE